MESRANSKLKRHIKAVQNTNEQIELLVFGYASRIYGEDEKTRWIDEERHLIAHPSDPSLFIDRYDCRLHIISLDTLNFGPKDRSDHDENGSYCPAETLEEEMCDEERYKDLNEKIRIQEEEDEDNRKRAEIGFNYDDVKNYEAHSSSSEEEVDEPFQAPENIKLPFGMNLPESMKQNAVIERTAMFVVAQGPQMEIVIKAKQRGSTEMFGFLEFDHPLNAYYKYISKMIREKKYVPTPHLTKKRPKLKKLLRVKGEKKQNEQQVIKLDQENSMNDSDDDSGTDDEGHYLHPLLMGSTFRDAPVIGPKTRDEHNKHSPKPSSIMSEIKFTKKNDMYSSLFKNLSDLLSAQAINAKAIESRDEMSPVTQDREADNGDYAEWYVGFYGEPPSSAAQPTVIPPPPDVMPAVNVAASYVAKYGCEAEKQLAVRKELNLHFLSTASQYYSYYQSRVRYYQWMHASDLYASSQALAPEESEGPSGERGSESDKELSGNDLEINPHQIAATNSGKSSPPSLLSGFLHAPPPPPLPTMNRKMRRRGFHDAPRTPESMVQKVTEVGLIEPEIIKVHSSPALLDECAKIRSKSVSPVTKKCATGPISFSLNTSKPDEKIPPSRSAVRLGAYEDEEFEENGETKFDIPSAVFKSVPAPGLTIPPPPVAPVPLSSGQLALEGSAELQSERKLKARLFMEKILNEKRAAKLRAQNEKQKAVAESSKKINDLRLLSSIGKSSSERVSSVFPSSDIEQIINSKIDKVLNETIAKEEKKSPRNHSINSLKKEKRRSQKLDDLPSKDCEKKTRRRQRSSEKHRSSMKKKKRHRSSSESVGEKDRHKLETRKRKKY